MTRERYQVLHKKNDRTDEEESEYEKICDVLLKEQTLAVPRPPCCKAAQEYPQLLFFAEDGLEPTKGHWSLAHIREVHAYLPDLATRWGDAFPEPKFCSYCGTALPKMVRKPAERLPKPLCVVEDGGYYCSTCHERGGVCLCLPPAAAFEPAV